MSNEINSQAAGGIVSKYRPESEPFVEDGFPDSEYDADEQFGRDRSRDDLDDGDDDDDVRDLDQRDQGDGRRYDAGPEPTAAEYADGDHTDTLRFADELRLRLDPAASGDRSDPGSGSRGNPATTFAEGASRIDEKVGRAERTPTRTGASEFLRDRAVAPGTEPILTIAVCQAKSASSLRDGSVSIVFHVPHELSAKGFEVHNLQDKPVRLELTEIIE